MITRDSLRKAWNIVRESVPKEAGEEDSEVASTMIDTPGLNYHVELVSMDRDMHTSFVLVAFGMRLQRALYEWEIRECQKQKL